MENLIKIELRYITFMLQYKDCTLHKYSHKCTWFKGKQPIQVDLVVFSRCKIHNTWLLHITEICLQNVNSRYFPQNKTWKLINNHNQNR